MKNTSVMTIAGLGLVGLAACTDPASDGRAQALLAMPEPQYFAELEVARDLTNRCGRYSYDAKTAEAMGKERVKRGGAPKAALQRPGSIGLETDVKKRSLGAKYGGDYNAADPCDVLDKEIAAQTPLSVVVKG